MKKLLSLVLSVIMILSALPVMASAEDVLTDVAINHSGFSSHFNEANHPLKVTDGDLTTKYLFSTGAWYYVDLGDAYTIDTVKLLLGNNYDRGEIDTNYTVYLSNTRMTSNDLPADAVTIGEIGDTPKTVGEDGYTDFSVTDETKYRFVIVKHTRRIDIYDMKVMTPDTVAENASYMVEVGAYKPIVATSVDGTTFPYYANDRSSYTEYVADDIAWTDGEETDPGLEQSIVIDLGEALPLHAITYWPTNVNRGGGVMEHWRSQNVSIYVTNDPNNATDVVVGNYDMEYLTNYLELPEVIKGNSYRYVVIKGGKVQKVNTSEYHRSLSIIDLGIYSDSTAAQQIYSSDTKDRTHLISIGAEAKGSYDDLSGDANTVYLSYPANVTDGDLETEWAVYGQKAGGDVYFVLDLMKPQTIDYVTAMSGSKYSENNVNRYAKIFVSNTDEFSTDNAVVMYEENENGMQLQNKMRLYSATEEMKGNKYRYVGVVIPDSRSVNASWWARTDLVMLDVYTKEASLDESFTEITFEQDEDVATKFSVKTDKLLSVTGRDYKFIAAAYDDNDKLLGIKTATISPEKGVGAALDTSIDFADEEYASKVVYARTMLWDMEGNLRPIVASAITPAETVVSKGKTAYNANYGNGSGWKSAVETTSKGFNLTDNIIDETKIAGWGPATVNGFAYLDLEEARKVDQITGNAKYERGSAGREIYLSNIKPNPTAEEAMAATGKTDAAEAIEAYYNLFTSDSTNADIKYVGNMMNVTGDFSFSVEDGGAYRYVMVKYGVGTASGDLFEMAVIRIND